MKKLRNYLPLICLTVFLFSGCGDSESVKTVEELNTTLDSVLGEVNTITDVETATQALQNLKKYEGREAQLFNKFKKMADDKNISAGAMLKLKQTQATVQQLQDRLTELSKDPKLRKKLKPIMDKYFNRDLPFAN